MARRSHPPQLPLLNWSLQGEITRLQSQREDLVGRISRLKRFSHRRVELEARLRIATARQLELEREIGEQS
ncbi:hypothetical protein [Tianweitania sediminis]|nr:hypothetical protein [Tianweitania sediminis]